MNTRSITEPTAIVILASTLRRAWAIIRCGQRGFDWAFMAERRPDSVARMFAHVVRVGEGLEGFVDRKATRLGILDDVLERAAYA
jgi:hypothetical protein